MKLFFTSSDEQFLKDSIVIYGVPSQNSIGQLAVDCLIGNTNCSIVGYIESEYILPISGCKAHYYDHL